MTDWKLIEEAFTKNLVTEPSFELGVGSWTTGGANTIAQDDTVQYRGVYSAKCTYQDNINLALFPFTFPAAGTYTLSARIWVPSDFDGDNVRITGVNYAGSTPTIVTRWIAPDDNPTGVWFCLETTFAVVGGDLVGSIALVVGTLPTATRFLYLDAVQVEAGDQITTYCDGDQQGCEWLGLPHNSQSQRGAEARTGGIVRDIGDFYDLQLGVQNGAGDLQHVVLVDSYTLHPGGELQSVTNESRVMQWTAQFADSILKGLHAKRQAFLRALSVDEVVNDNGQPQETRIIYTGAAVDKEIDVSLESGMGATFRAEDCIKERLALSFVAADPMWRALEDSGVELDPVDVPSFESVLARLRSNDGAWDVLGPPSSAGLIDTIIRADDGSTYWGGSFNNFDGIAAADNLVQRDVDGTWVAIGAGLDGRVRGSAKASNGDIYFVGDFTNGGTYNYIVKLDVSTGNLVAVMVNGPNNGLNAAAYDCAFGTNGKLYVAGTHTDVDGGPGGTYNKVIEYNPSADGVAALGAGLAGGATIGKAVSRNPLDGHIIIGGICTTADGVPAINVADWTPATATVPGVFVAMGAGLAGGAVNTISTNNQGTSFAFGEFGTNFNYAAQYNGQQWLSMGTGLVFDSLLPPPVQVFDSTIAPDGTVIAAGRYNKAGNIRVTHGLAGWNGSNWFSFDLHSGHAVLACLADNPDLLNSDIYDLWTGWESGTTTIDIAGITTATNGGTGDAYPIITISREGGSSANIVSMINNITGDRLLFNYALQDGEELIIDTNYLGQSIVSNFNGSRQGAIVQPSDLGKFALKPGENPIAVLIWGVGAPTVKATMRWRNTYKSFD